MKEHFGVPQLEQFILDDIKSKQEYAEKANATPFTLAMKQKRIEQLIKINNGIYVFEHPEAWLYVELQMKRIAELDPNSNGFRIEFNISPGKGLPSHIVIPPDCLC